MDQNEKKQDLLDEGFLRRLEQLNLVVRKAAAGKLRGERKSRRRGIGVDFADYRDYVQGDDPRFIDWNIYGRLERLFLKLFVEEEDLTLHILLDTSASMGFGDPSKLRFGRLLAAALAYIALAGQNRVTIHPFSADPVQPLGPLRGKRNVFRVFDYLSGLEASGRTHLAAAARTWSLSVPRRGAAVLISDFLDEGEGGSMGFEDALPFLGGRALDLHAVQVFSREEVDPSIKGDVKLIDSESGMFTEITMGEPILRRYRRNLQGFLERVRGTCVARGMPWLFVTTDQPFERVVLEAFRRGGLLR